MTTIQCTTQGVITAAERLCRQITAEVRDMEENYRPVIKPTNPLLIKIAEHPGVEGPQLWYAVGPEDERARRIEHTGWTADVVVMGSIIYVDADDLRD
jgi:hypothetical protein